MSLEDFCKRFQGVVEFSAVSSYTAQKMKFSIKDFFSKYDQIRSFFIFCVVSR